MTGDEFMIELPPTLRLTYEDMEDPETAAEVAEFREAYPDGEVIVSEDATCPHCAAQGIRVDEHGIIRDAVTGEVASSSGVHVSLGPRQPSPSGRRKASRKAQRVSRRKNR